MARKKKVDLNFDEQLSENYEDYIRTKEKDDEDVVKVIPTGSLSLDVSLGIGGIPKRRFTEIYGAESTGKTTLALTIAKNAIEGGDAVLYVDAEQAVDFTYGQKIIGDAVYDQDKFLLIQPEIMEDALQISEDGIREKRFGLVILDSIASMAPKKVKEETLEDSNPYILAKMMTKFVQRNGYDLRYFDAAFIGVNQIRDDTQNPYIRSVSPPGGHAWKHILSVQIELRRASWIKAGDNTIGLSTKFVIKKNKVAPPFRSFNFPIMFGIGIDYYRDAVDFAESLGILGKAGAYYTFEGQTIGKGVVATAQKLKSDKDVLDKIINACYNAVSYDDVDEGEIKSE